MSVRGRWDWPAAGAVFAGALAVRLHQHQPGLLYPDGYQYLLMARGIAEHLRPTTLLGPGGDLFVPNADAAAKPLFPALVAAVNALGFSWLAAARLVTAVSAAAVVALTGLVGTRLGGSRAGGAAAAALVLASPTVAYWSGFSGPDALAVALALAAVLALAGRREWLGGVLAGLAGCARPELLALAALFAVAAVVDPSRRRAVARASAAGVLAVAAVLAVLRPPLALPDPELLALFPAALVAALLAGLARRGLPLVGTLALAAAGAAPAVAVIWRDEWPLVVPALAGFAAAALHPRLRTRASGVALAAALLVAVYWVKNPQQERYLALVVPAVALLAALGVAAVRARAAAAAAVVGVAALVGVSSAPAGRASDGFAAVAARVARTVPPATPIVTAAPEAYSFWLPDRPVRILRDGSRGAVLLDAAQRAYAPRADARGAVLARLAAGATVFVGPSGDVDAGVARVVLGTVERADDR